MEAEVRKGKLLKRTKMPPAEEEVVEKVQKQVKGIGAIDARLIMGMKVAKGSLPWKEKVDTPADVLAELYMIIGSFAKRIEFLEAEVKKLNDSFLDHYMSSYGPSA
jgi:hypothetical protein